MKIQMNVFPMHHRCEPIDYKAIFFMGVSLIAMIAIIAVVYVISYFSYSAKKSSSEEPVQREQATLRRLEGEVQKKNVIKQKTVFDEKKKIELNKEIIEFNKIKRDFHWGLFFQKLEELTPDRIWVKNFVISRFPSFYMSCEASDIFKPIEFVKNLEMSEYFKKIFLGKAEEDKESMAIRFTLEMQIDEKKFKEGN